MQFKAMEKIKQRFKHSSSAEHFSLILALIMRA